MCRPAVCRPPACTVSTSSETHHSTQITPNVPAPIRCRTCLLKADGCAIEEDMACYGVTDEEGSEAELEKAMGAGGVVATSGLILVGALGATLAALLKFK